MARPSVAEARRSRPTVALALVRLDDVDEWLRSALPALSEQERAAIDSMSSRDARARHAVGRATIRLIAAAACGCAPSRVAIAVSEAGKPRLADLPELHVSVAHTGRVVVVASCWHTPVGVDVEPAVTTAKDPRRLAQRFFAEAEIATSRNLADAEFGGWFSSVWTIKEAVGKALGVGIAPALSGAVVEPGAEGLVLNHVWSGPPADRWTLHQLLDGEETIAVALPAPQVELAAIWRLELAEFPPPAQ